MNEKPLLTCHKCGYKQRPKRLRVDKFSWVDRFYRYNPRDPFTPKICGQCQEQRSYNFWKKNQEREQKERFNGEPEFELDRVCDRRELEF